MISGYVEENQYTLEVTNIGTSSVLFKVTAASRDACVSNFESAPILTQKQYLRPRKRLRFYTANFSVERWVIISDVRRATNTINTATAITANQVGDGCFILRRTGYRRIICSSVLS